MIGTSNARVRQFITLTCLVLIFLFAVIIMGLVGVNGKITFRSFNKGCLLYMSVDGDVLDYNNAYCLFPIIAAAVLAFISLIFLMYWSLALKRRDEFVPRSVSLSFLLVSFLCTLLAFAICGEIGIGLNKGCKVLGDQKDRCRKTNNFNALWGAEICAGIIGGLWLIAILLELFQLKRQPARLLSAASSVDHFSQTTVIPHRANTTTSTAAGDRPHPVLGGATPRVQKTEYTQPEMTQQQHPAQTQAQGNSYVLPPVTQGTPVIPPEHSADPNPHEYHTSTKE